MIYLIHQGLDRSADRYPEHPAMRFKGQSLTYAELAQRSNQLANFLLEQGVSRGDHIGVYLNKSLETVIAIYGIMKAGAAYVPLDPKSPVARLVGIIEDCELKGIISEKNKKSSLQEVAIAQNKLKFIIGLSDIEGVSSYSWDDIATMPLQIANPPRLMEHDLAYVMYTSGTTGKPKGIMHTHYSGLSYVKTSSSLYNITREDRLSNHSPLHFDMSTLDYLTAVYCGAMTTIIPEAYTLFPANLTKLVQDERLTIWYSVPFALIQMLMRGVMEERDFSSLRWILYGGEPFPASHMKALMERLPHVQVSNVYGPAEVNQVTHFTLPRPDRWDSEDYRIPIGNICDNMQSLILDENDNPVAQDEAGELLVRTGHMMQGYRGRPDLNEKVFYRREPYPGFEEVYLRTGDLVTLREDGLLDFLGRKDHQVKVRGFRVELSEIDTVLTSFDAVEEASSFVIRKPDGDEIQAAVTLIAGKKFDERKLLAHSATYLTNYAVPSKIIVKETFPRGATGKINRRALQEEAQAQLDRGAE